MIERLVRYLEGGIRFEAEGGRFERFINECEKNGLELEKISPTQTGFTANTTPAAYKKMHSYAQKNRCRLHVNEKHGAYFALHKKRKRFGIAVGLICSIILLFLGQNLIWNICFYDFTPQQEVYLRERLFENGIYEGAVKNQEKLLDTAGKIFEGTEEYGWLTLNFVKGRLVVEKTKREPAPELIGQEYTDVVAASDALIQNVIPQGGFVCARKGQYVTKGQVLVKGLREGEYGKVDFTHAQAQVLAEVEKTYRCTQPLKMECQVSDGAYKSYYKLWLPWGALPLYGNIEAAQNAKITVSHRPLAPFGFHLPATIEEISVRPQKTAEMILSPQAALEKAYSRIMDDIRREFGEFSILHEQRSEEITDQDATLTVKIRFTADIARTVPGAPWDETQNQTEKEEEWQ